MPAGAGAAGSGGAWHDAVQVPGTAVAGNEDVEAVSCGSATNCTALGWYTGRSGWAQAFVASES